MFHVAQFGKGVYDFIPAGGLCGIGINNVVIWLHILYDF